MSTERVKRNSAKAAGFYMKLNSVGREAEVDMDPDQVPTVDDASARQDSEGTSSNQDGSSSPSASSSGSASSSSGSDSSDSKSDSDTTQNNKESEKPAPTGKPAPLASKVVNDADSESNKKKESGQSRSRARGKNTQVLRTVSSPPAPPSVHIVDITLKADERKIDSDSFDEPDDVEVKRKRRSVERRRSPSPLGSPRHVTPERVVDPDPDELQVESPDTSRRRAIEAIRANNAAIYRHFWNEKPIPRMFRTGGLSVEGTNKLAENMLARVVDLEWYKKS